MTHFNTGRMAMSNIGINDQNYRNS